MLLQPELTPVRPAADERVVRQHDDVASSGTFDGARERRHHLVLGVGGAGRGRVLMPVVRVEPPLRVEGHEPQPVAGIDHLRAGAAVVRKVDDRRAAAFLDAPLLAANRLPAGGASPGPVVVAGDEDDPRRHVLDRVHLVVEAPIHLRPLGVVRRRQAVRVEVVAQEDDRRPAPGALELRAQRDQDGLAPLRRLSGIADQEQRLGDGVRLGRGQWRGTGRRGLGGEQQRGGEKEHWLEANMLRVAAAGWRRRGQRARPALER